MPLFASRSTIDVRAALYTPARRQSEDIREKVRRIHATSLKKGHYGKHSQESTAVRTCPGPMEGQAESNEAVVPGIIP
jgi:hypothetical protein